MEQQLLVAESFFLFSTENGGMGYLKKQPVNEF